jgi:hypothetical protein
MNRSVADFADGANPRGDATQCQYRNADLSISLTSPSSMTKRPLHGRKTPTVVYFGSPAILVLRLRALVCSAARWPAESQSLHGAQAHSGGGLR